MLEDVPEVLEWVVEAMTNGLIINATTVISDRIVARRLFLGGMAKSACKR